VSEYVWRTDDEKSAMTSYLLFLGRPRTNPRAICSSFSKNMEGSLYIKGRWYMFTESI
jgi:hypothetical protein